MPLRAKRRLPSLHGAGCPQLCGLPSLSTILFFVSLSHLGLRGLRFLVTLWGSAWYVDLQILHLFLTAWKGPLKFLCSSVPSASLFQSSFISPHQPIIFMEYLIDVKRCAGYEGETKMNLTWAGSCLSGASRRVGEKNHFSKSQRVMRVMRAEQMTRLWGFRRKEMTSVRAQGTLDRKGGSESRRCWKGCGGQGKQQELLLT